MFNRRCHIPKLVVCLSAFVLIFNASFMSAFFNVPQALADEVLPGNSSITGHKYEDLDKAATTTVDWLALPDWTINLFVSTSTAPIVSTTTDAMGYFAFMDLADGDYVVSEELQTGWMALIPTSTNITLLGNQSTTTDFVNYKPICGNQILDTEIAEQCDDGNLLNGDGCSSVCQLEKPQAGDVIINELMWMGSSGDPYDEWLELFNTTGNELSLTNCKLTKKNGDEIANLDNLSISPNSYLVVSRKNKENSKINIDPDLVTSMSLSNEELGIKLICDDAEIDAAGDGTNPLAGSNGTPKKSMSRKLTPGDGTLAENWCAASTQANWDDGATELGTPGAQNFCEGGFGSLTINKYSDLDGDMTTTADQELATSTIWTFFAKLNGSSQMATSTATTTDGIANFIDLEIGDYTVTEQVPDGWYLLGADFTNPVSVNSNATTTINFYNTPYASISGYKFEDLDGSTTTVTDLAAKAGWTIYLYNASATTTLLTSTTTDSEGEFEFNQVKAGGYLLDEEIPVGWTQLKAPTSTILILTGNSASTNNNFINYFQGGQGGEPEPEPSPPVLPSAGGGGFTARPSVNLSASYPAEKELGKEVLETLVVSNDGNIILTNGVLTLDLNQEKLRLESAFPVWSSFDQTEQKAVWNIAALAVGGEQSINLTVMPLVQGLAETNGAVVFDQTEDFLIYSEIINPSSLGFGGEVPSTGEGGGELSPPLPAGGQPAGGETTASPIEQESETETVVAGQESEQGPEIVVIGGEGAVKGSTAQTRPVCPWWIWLLAVILHLWTIGGYSFIIKAQSSKKDVHTRLPAPDAAGYGGQGELPFSAPFPWLWLSLVVISLAVIYILFLTVCHFPALALGLVFLGYLAVLAAYHFIISKKKQGLWAFVPLLTAIAPIAVYLFAGVWAWWLWLLILGLYILSIIFYYSAIFKEANSHSWWWTILFLTLLVLALEIAIARHLPSG